MRKERWWVCPGFHWWGHRKKSETHKACPECGRAMRAVRKFPEAAYQRWKKDRARTRIVEARETRRNWKVYAVLRGAGQRRGGRAVRISARTRGLFSKVGQTKDKWSRGRAVERVFKSFGKDIGADKPAVLNWVESANTLGIYHYRTNNITLAHDQEDLAGTIAHEMVHWADDVAGFGTDKKVGSHTSLFYSRVGWLVNALRMTPEGAHE